MLNKYLKRTETPKSPLGDLGVVLAGRDGGRQQGIRSKLSDTNEILKCNNLKI